MTMMFNLLPGWTERLARPSVSPLQELPTPPLPKLPDAYHHEVRLVSDAKSASDMLELALCRPIAYVGFDAEFRYGRAPVPLRNGKTATDRSSIVPLLLSLAFVEHDAADETARVYRFVVDVHNHRDQVLPVLRELLRQPWCFVGHYMTMDLACLWKLGIDEPRTIWDTWVAEKALRLGLDSVRQAGPDNETGSEAEEARAREEAEALSAIRFDLRAVCRRHGVPYRFTGDKGRLQRSFLAHPVGGAFTGEQVDYASADAEAAAALYLRQQLSAGRAGLADHLTAIEMPWCIVNARIAWHGVKIDGERRRAVARRCDGKLGELEDKLRELGIGNFRSHRQLVAFFGAQGLLEAFREGGNYTFGKDKLKELKHLHPAVKLLYDARRVQSLKTDAILLPALDGADGRVHADHLQLGAASGRQSCKHPNLLGLDKTLRPLIVPAPGCGIGEVDLSQIEVGIAAAVYGDDRLIELFNTGDVYSRMAQLFYADQLGDADRLLDGASFKRTHPQLRETMKTCTLGIIYGLTAFGLSVRLSVEVQRAEQLLNRFMDMFPALKQALDDVANYAILRGFATTSSGLRRYRTEGSRVASQQERNWMRNHPIQGTAADLFKMAGIRLDRLYRRYGAKLIIPFHDAFVFEAPLDHLGEVTALTERVMCEVIEEFFPRLRPRAERNVSHPECWNKAGGTAALDEWLRPEASASPAVRTDDSLPSTSNETPSALSDEH
ncbi:MAG TPA: DNA polymerase [Tepidisphaeraceae bacterium]|jgi:DNA polymerase-1